MNLIPSRLTVIAAGLFLGSIIAVEKAEAASTLTFNGASLKVLDFTPEKNTGLDRIYVVYDVSGVSASYTSVSGQRPRVLRYSNLGGGYAEEVTGAVFEGNTVTIENIQGDMGYIIEDGDATSYFWVVNYLPHRLQLRSADIAPEQECGSSMITVDGQGEPIHYFTISGQQRVLSREIEVDYTTLEWNQEQKIYLQKDETEVFEALTSTLTVRPAALCATEFTVSGDRFLKAWNWLQTVSTPEIRPVSVEVHTEAVQEPRDDSDSETGSNMIKGDDSALGGSAPATIEFLAYPSDGVIHHEWQMSKRDDFEEVDYRFNEQDLTYTFTEEGTVYVRYVGANDDGSCEAYGDVYTVAIGASDLKCPNAFSPNGDGVNDEWKVSYRSLLDFRCWIFDRYGNQLYYFDDPAGGWDGNRGGKPVKSGVYYYVIQATGSDGKKYKMSGDINILRSKTSYSGGQTGGAGE